ncbi:MAG TPA: ABC transporter permease, partial [Planctomycetaceae bacterium]|nr:ABC transporter permease [Planctomycetaceae bacterium]
MLISLAWKNVWRNKKRSLIIVLSIAFGLWGGLIAGAVMMGLGESMVNTAIDRDLAHIQIHQKGFLRDKEITKYIPDGLRVVEKAKKIA